MRVKQLIAKGDSGRRARMRLLLTGAEELLEEARQIRATTEVSIRRGEALSRILRAAAANVADAERLAETLERRDLVERYERVRDELRALMAGQDSGGGDVAEDGGPLEGSPGDERPGGALQ